MQLIKKGQTAESLLFFMGDTNNGLIGVTGLTLTPSLSKNGAAFAAAAGACSEVGNGWYKIAGNATDAGTFGTLIVNATNAGAKIVNTLARLQVVDLDPEEIGVGAIAAAVHGARRCRYVHTGGNDSNAGDSPLKAWKTISNAMTSSSTRDMVMINGGTYNESANSMIPTTNIVIRACGMVRVQTSADSQTVGPALAGNTGSVWVNAEWGRFILENTQTLTSGQYWNGIGFSDGLTNSTTTVAAAHDMAMMFKGISIPDLGLGVMSSDGAFFDPNSKRMHLLLDDIVIPGGQSDAIAVTLTGGGTFILRNSATRSILSGNATNNGPQVCTGLALGGAGSNPCYAFLSNLQTLALNNDATYTEAKGLSISANTARALNVMAMDCRFSAVTASGTPYGINVAGTGVTLTYGIIAANPIAFGAGAGGSGKNNAATFYQLGSEGFSTGTYNIAVSGGGGGRFG